MNADNWTESREGPATRAGTAAAVLMASNVVAALAPVLVASSDAPYTVFGMWRMWLGAAGFGVIVLASRRRRRARPSRDPIAMRSSVRVAAVAGVLLAAEHLSFLASVRLTSVTTYSIVGVLLPVVSVLLARLFLGERTHTALLGFAAVAIAGAALGVAGSGGVMEVDVLGVGVTVVSITMLASYLLALKRLPAGGMSPDEFLVTAFGLTATIITVAAVVQHGGDLLMPWEDLRSVALMALVPGLAGHLGASFAAPHLPAVVPAIGGLTVAPMAAFLAHVALDEPLTGGQVLGGCVAMVGVLGALLFLRRAPAEELPPAHTGEIPILQHTED